MEVGQGPNWGCSAKEKNINIYFRYVFFLRLTFMHNFNYIEHPLVHGEVINFIAAV
jgi:hypothetical protein